MKVNPLLSITAKLFYLVFFVVATTAALLSWKSTSHLEKILEEQLKDRSVNDSSTSGRAIEGYLENWESQLAIILQSTVGVDEDQRKEQVKTFLGTSEDYLSVDIFEIEKSIPKELLYRFTDATDSNRFEKQEANSVSEKIKWYNRVWLKKYLKGKDRPQLFIRSLAHRTGLPILNIGKIFKVSQSDTKFAIILTVWQNPLIESFVESSIIKNFMIDWRGKVISSRDLGEMVRRKSYKKYGMVRKALKGATNMGFSPGYSGGNKEWVGGYYRIPKFNILVVSQQDRDSAYGDIRKSMIDGLKWGGLFVMIAVLFAFFGADGLTRTLKSVTDATLRIAEGDLATRIKPTSKDEIAQLGYSVNTMAEKITNFLEAEVAQAEVRKDLETADMVQRTLLPKNNRFHGQMVVDGFCKSASLTGGDWWGHYSTEDGIEYVFIADAMGHGVPAALVTAVAYSSCMTLAAMFADTNQLYGPSQILQKINKVLYDAVEGTISMTFFVLMVDYHKGEVRFANAGHNIPVVIPLDTKDDRIKKRFKSLKKFSDRTPISLAVNGNILGVEPGLSFDEQSIELRPGDKFFLFTDGLIECKSPKGKMWGRKVMLEKIMKNVDLSAPDLLKKVVDDAFEFFADQPRDDDVTVVVADFPSEAKIGGYRKSDKLSKGSGWVAGNLPEKPSFLDEGPKKASGGTDLNIDLPALPSLKK